MQESQQVPPPGQPKLPFKKRIFLLVKVMGQGKNLWKARKEGSKAEQAEETLNNALRSLGAAEEGIGFSTAFIHAWRKMRRDDEAFHTVDRYLVGGIGVLDLVLYQILVSVGHPDFASSLAWIAFAVSFPCAIGSLFSSFVKKANKITVYGNIHSGMSILAEVSTLISVTALISHVWLVAGLLFFFIALTIAIICLIYITLISIGKHLQLPKPLENTDIQTAPPETKPTETNIVPESEKQE